MNSLRATPPVRRQVSYVISIWSEHLPEHAAIWHGVLETTAGQRFNFETLAELERLLCELGGWMDPSDIRSGKKQS